MKAKNLIPRGSSTGIKFIIIGILVFLFLIPLLMVRELISERSGLKNQVQREIVDSWGGENMMAGPYVIIPYTEFRKYYDQEKESYQEQELRMEMLLLPEVINMNVDNRTEVRYRGIYSVPVFISDIEISGHFSLFGSIESLDERNILWDEMMLGYSMASMKSLSSLSIAEAGGQVLDFSPGSVSSSPLDQQITAPWKGLTGNEENLPFRLSMTLKGGSSIRFLPMAKETTVVFNSDWSAPSFIGDYLPMERNIDEAGTRALWRVNYLSRSFPQSWTVGTGDEPYIHDSAFGLTMLEPVTSYTKNTRTAKYGILFLIIPFSVFFLFEVITSRRIHPIQYFIAGAGNAVFYLLLLSISEHLGFNTAYLISSAAVIGMVSLYTRSVLGKSSRGWIMAPILAICYSYLFVVLQSEDYALLMGSIGLFILIGVMMYLTRKIDWYGKDV